MNNKPKQLERIRKEHYDELYKRQPQLIKRLAPLIHKSEIIENYTEPPLHSPNDPLDKKLREPRLNKELRNKLNKFNNSKKIVGLKKVRKISDIRPDILFGLN